MYDSRRYGGLTTSPVKFLLSESPFKKQLKALISLMINMDPAERPTVDQVLQELTTIAGET